MEYLELKYILEKTILAIKTLELGWYFFAVREVTTGYEINTSKCV